MKNRKPRLVQFTPEGPPCSFEVRQVIAGANFWHFTLREQPLMTHGFEPEYRYTPPKKAPCPFTMHELAIAGVERCNEARGMVCLQEFRDNSCVFTAAFVGNSRFAFCVWSADEDRAKPVDTGAMRRHAREAIAEARKLRR